MINRGKTISDLGLRQEEEYRRQRQGEQGCQEVEGAGHPEPRLQDREGLQAGQQEQAGERPAGGRGGGTRFIESRGRSVATLPLNCTWGRSFADCCSCVPHIWHIQMSRKKKSGFRVSLLRGNPATPSERSDSHMFSHSVATPPPPPSSSSSLLPPPPSPLTCTLPCIAP